MKCWYCQSELIWQNDFDYSDYCIDDKDGIVSILSCPSCGAYYECYLDLSNDEEE